MSLLIQFEPIECLIEQEIAKIIYKFKLKTGKEEKIELTLHKYSYSKDDMIKKLKELKEDLKEYIDNDTLK